MRDDDKGIKGRTLVNTQLIRRSITYMPCPVCAGRGALHLGDKCTNCNTKGKVKIFTDVIIKNDLQSNTYDRYLKVYEAFGMTNGRSPTPKEQYRMFINILNKV